MTLNALWFILIGVLFTGFFLLEGFDYGVGILLPFLGKKDEERRILINTIGPVWDANEVWLLTAGGAMFAAFPNWYATLFSGFYLALLLMLVALIVRGVAFEFRSKDKHPAWRALWDWCIFGGSFVPALLWGVALANIVRGVPINADMQYVGGFFNLLNPYALLGGLVAVAVMTLHGAIFLSLRTTDAMQERAHKAAQVAWPVATLLLFALVVATYFATDIFTRLGVNPGISAIGSGIAVLLAARLGLRHDVVDDRPHHRHRLPRALPARDGVQPEPRVEPDDLQRVFLALHAQGDDDCRADLRADRADLPRVELLRVSRPGDWERRSEVLGRFCPLGIPNTPDMEAPITIVPG